MFNWTTLLKGIVLNPLLKNCTQCTPTGATDSNIQKKSTGEKHNISILLIWSPKDTTVQFHHSQMGEMSETVPLMYYESVANIMLGRQTNDKPFDNLKLRHIFGNSV